MWLGLLGPLNIHHDGVHFFLPAAKQRVVLAALTLHAGKPVSAGQLADTLWGGSPPSSEGVTVRNYIKRLRQKLGPVIGSRIVSRYPGYQIEAADNEIDLLAFTSLCEEGRAAAEGGDWRRAFSTLTSALRLWRGVPLEDIPSDLLKRDHVPHLEHLRYVAMEDRFEAGLQVGLHRELTPELHALLREQPFRERAAGQLMLALYRSGLRSDALAAYRATRHALAEELAIDPGPDLTWLHQRILAGDPRLAGPQFLEAAELPAADRAARGSRPVPRQVPADIRHFAGRHDAMQTLTLLADEAATAVPIAAVAGAAGLGKTALAVHWAHQAAGRFPDGQLYASLRDAAGPLSPGEVIRLFLDALGVSAASWPATLDGQVALYRSLLAGKRMLVVLDDAADAGQVRPLLPGSAGCMVVVTSRDSLTELVAANGAHPLALGPLSEAEAHDLLARLLGREWLAAEPAAASELVMLCGRLPRSLSEAAVQVVSALPLKLSTIVEWLRRSAPAHLTGTDNQPADCAALSG